MVRVGLSHKETRLGRSSVGKSGSTHQAAPTGHTHPDRCQVEFSILFIATSAFAYSAWEGLTELDCPCQKPRHAMKEVLFEHRVLSVNTFPLSTIHRFMKTIALKTHSSSLSKRCHFNFEKAIAEWEKVWSGLSAHLQPFFSAHSAYFNNF